MKEHIFTINFSVYFFLFSLFYKSVNCKDVCFMVNFSDKSPYFLKTAKEYREYLFKITAFVFGASLIFCEIFKGYFYFGLFNLLYISLIMIKYLNCRNEIKKEALKNEKEKSKTAFPFAFSVYDFYFNLFLCFYDFYLIYKIKNNGQFIFSDTLYIIPVTLFFLNMIIIISAKLIKDAPDFNIKEVKIHLVNFLWILNLAINIIFIFYTNLILYKFSYAFTLLGIILIIASFFALLTYYQFIKDINRPYNFRVENEKITNGRFIEINLTGTRLFINLKNKKSYLFLTGFIVVILIYIFLVYLFTI